MSQRFWTNSAALTLLLLACGCADREATTASDAAAAVKETLAAARAKQRVRIRVRLERSEMPSTDDLKLRDAIEEQIVRERLGTIVQREAGVGWFDIELEVDSTADAVPRVRSILRSMELLDRASVEIRQAG